MSATEPPNVLTPSGLSHVLRYNDTVQHEFAKFHAVDRLKHVRYCEGKNCDTRFSNMLYQHDEGVLTGNDRFSGYILDFRMNGD